MPIRLNLLADAQAAEELRRKDPVKRAMWVSGFIIFVVVLWSTSLQLKVFIAKSELQRTESQWKSMEKPHKQLTEGLRKGADVERKIEALVKLSTNRFLWANMLQSLQVSLVPNVHVTHFRSEQNYLVVEPTAERKTPSGTIPAKPGSSLEKIGMLIEARDYGQETDQNYNKFKAALAGAPLLKSLIPGPDAVRLIHKSSLMLDPIDPTKTYMSFSLECQFPEVKRNE
jgi:hypothetical protein